MFDHVGLNVKDYQASRRSTRLHTPPPSRPAYAAFVFDPDGNNIEAVCHAVG